MDRSPPPTLSPASRITILVMMVLAVALFQLIEREWRQGIEEGSGPDGRQIAVLGPDDIPLEEVREEKPEPTRPADTAEVSGERTYVIQAGDNLGEISKRVYGRASKWRKIYQANRDVLKDPHRLKVGATIKIP